MTPVVRWDEKSFLPLCHRSSASARTYDTVGTVIVWALSTSSLKHKAWLFRGNHSMAPCLGSPCVLCLIARLTRQIKQPILLIGDLILYVTFLNFWLVLGFLMQEVGRFFFPGRGASVLGQHLYRHRTASPLGGCYLSRSQPPGPSYLLHHFIFWNILTCGVLSVGQTKWITSAQLNWANTDLFYSIVTSLTQLFQICMTTSLCCVKADF